MFKRSWNWSRAEGQVYKKQNNNKIKDPTELKALLDTEDEVLSDGQWAGQRWSTILGIIGGVTGLNWWTANELVAWVEGSEWGSKGLKFYVKKKVQKLLI